MLKNDLLKRNISRLLVFGESNAFGYNATDFNGWVNIFVQLLKRFQDTEIELINSSVPASVISPKSSGYSQSAKPSLVEQFEDKINDVMPDTVMIAYGLNDARCGNPEKSFLSDYSGIIDWIKKNSDIFIIITTI